MWVVDTATAEEFPGAEWTVDDGACLRGVVDSDEDAGIWADYLGIDLTRTEAGTLGGRRDYAPDGSCGPVVPVFLTSTLTAGGLGRRAQPPGPPYSGLDR